MASIPTAVLTIRDEATWREEMLAYARSLEAAGERAWFEVRWPAPVNLSPEEAEAWFERQNETYDAVEVVAGEIHTLPPYTELLEEED